MFVVDWVMTVCSNIEYCILLIVNHIVHVKYHFMFEEDLGKMKLNEAGRKNWETSNSWRRAKREKLYSDLLRV